MCHSSKRIIPFFTLSLLVRLPLPRPLFAISGFDTPKVLAFIDEVIGEPAYIAGNSLGGYIAANLAANHPRAVRGLALMNATPFWAFRKPIIRTAAAAIGNSADSTTPSDVSDQSDAGDAMLPAAPASEDASINGDKLGTEEGGSVARGGDWLGWDGILPAPEGFFRFGAWYFDRMRDPRTVKSMLGAVYSNAGGSCCADLVW